MKFIAATPSCADRYPLRLTAPVSFDGNLFHVGALVEVSDTQVVELVMHSLAEAALDSEVRETTAAVIRPRAVIEFADDSMSPRQRKRWRPHRIANRVAPRGSVRLDAGSGLIEQIRGIVKR
jgi:hypothetical protein